MESKKFLNADEVAAEFGLDAASLKGFVDAGDVRALADRGTWKYRRDELEALVAAGKIEPPAAGYSLAGQETSKDEPVEYIEIDEAALAEQASAQTRPPSDPNQDWFVPSDVAEMKEPAAVREQSSSDVAIYSGAEPTAAEASSLAEGSDSDVVLMPGTKTAERLNENEPEVSALNEGSDSDVQIAPDYNAPKPEDSGIVLDFNLDAGATVASSGSSLRLPQGAGSEETEAAEIDTLSGEPVDESVLDHSSATSFDESNVNLDVVGGSAIQLGADSDVQLVDVAGSGVMARNEESGILLDEGSHLGMPGGSSLAGGAVEAAANEDSGITLKYLQGDSGISVEPTPAKAAAKQDSGISLGGGDSGISLSAGDSGISLGGGDSGISLGGLDSGLSLQSAESGISLGGGDSGIAVEGNSKTMSDLDLFSDQSDDQTRTLDVREEQDDSGLDLNNPDATAELLLDDEDADDTSATVVKKGRKATGLSGAFEMEDASVEDLEISEDLDSGSEEEVEEFIEEEEAVLDASDDTFGAGEVEADEDEEYLAPAAAAKKTGPREPAWGTPILAGLVVCTVFLTANFLVLWSGVSTMWTGSEPLAPAAPLIDSLGGLLGR